MLKYKIVSLLIVQLGLVYCEYKYETKWFKVPLDHFGFQRTETFSIRYLVNEEHWDREDGPIFFYTGNEGRIETFAQYTGFMWDIAADYRAKLVFAEHRYYGQSLPFGNKSLDNEHIGYLTSSQALADYADLIDHLQGNVYRPTGPKYPVIAFGGSYGGLLAAYMRTKYPHLVTGAIAASAPMRMFPDMVPCDVFHKRVTSSFKVANRKCVKNIKNSWTELRVFLGSEVNSDWLLTNWKLCDPISNFMDMETLIVYLRSMYGMLAMGNYPFPSDFLVPLPANPVKTVCQFLTEDMNATQLMVGLGKVIQVYANYSGKAKCVNYRNHNNIVNLDASTWAYQACTEMVTPMCTTGKSDMFHPAPWNFTEYAKYCQMRYNVYPRPDAARIRYGGDRIKAASNIVFSNGLLDPWAGGGILNSISPSITAVVIANAAHHLDLMASNPQDPESVLMARNIHRQNIDTWLRVFREHRSEKQ